MYSSNVFAVLTACDQLNKASSAFKLTHNKKWLHPATGGIAVAPTIGSREATPADDVSFNDLENHADRLIITFDELLNDHRTGLQFGTSQSACHVLLGHAGTIGISRRQYNIAVDRKLRLQLHDYYSSHGTAVTRRTYVRAKSSEAIERPPKLRKRETWTLAKEPGSPNYMGDIFIHCGRLIVQIEFPNHTKKDWTYIGNLKALYSKKPGLPLLEGIQLDSVIATQQPTESATPTQHTLYYWEEELGRGQFGTVRKVIRARDGEVFAAKEFRHPSHDRSIIRREYKIMRDNPHPNIIEAFDFWEEPNPVIFMALYCDGNMFNARGLSTECYITAFGQVLDGLAHLHAQGVVHRDLKPENLLIDRGPPLKVVLTDFGLANVSKQALLNTFCGTLRYAAPEIIPGLSGSYGNLVDVWSLGVIGYEWFCDVSALKLPGLRRGKTLGEEQPQLCRW
ncbi:hypothetical protein K4F52_010317, partial [Lecanicillium sp. MT-2017a]